jgi:hypothetical protein
MAKGISLNIGLNRVDPNGYNGWDGQLAGCENDARDMQSIADAQGFTTTLMLTDEATSAAVIEAIGRAAQDLAAGDTFLLTYSGHGGQVPDANGDEDDGQDETWVLYDRMLVDDELYQLWSQFSAGVRIFMLSDSCHSGTVARNRAYQQLLSTATGAGQYRTTRSAPPKMRAIPAETAQQVYNAHRDLYRTAQWISGKGDRSSVNACILLISGCQDNQLSADGDGNGLFTGTLKEVWDGGSFQGSYYAFYQQIADKMPPSQSPNYYTAGQSDSAFEAERPFTVGDGVSPNTNPTPTTTYTDPSVTGPSSSDRNGAAPTFTLDSGGRGYCTFEITSDLGVFSDYNLMTDANFWANWNDSSVASRLSDTNFPLPDGAWQLAQSNDLLYYRIGATSSPSDSGWDDYAVTAEQMLNITSDRDHRPPTTTRDAPPIAAEASPFNTEGWTTINPADAVRSASME